MEVMMEEYKLSAVIPADTPKKAYTKPVISQIRLVAEEAVLALCKWNIVGARGDCMPDRSCVFTRRS
jgi:hypothetical protein